MFLGGVLGVWSSLFLVSMVATQTNPAEACAGQGSDRLVALVPAVLSFLGAVMVAWLNRPERRAKRRRRAAS